jgi:hypothetical protein
LAAKDIRTVPSGALSIRLPRSCAASVDAVRIRRSIAETLR